MPPLPNTCWNLFLALVPVALGLLIGWVSWHDRDLRKHWYVWLPLTLLWLGFLPNTCYLLTEWRHFIEWIVKNPDLIHDAPRDRHAMAEFLAVSGFYVVYSSLGLLTFSMAIWPVEQWLKLPRWGKFLFFLACALGVYLGLVKRLNTWDVLNNPDAVVGDSAAALTHPFSLAMIVLFSLLIWANYWIFEVFVDGFVLRMRRIKAERAKS